MGRSRAYLALAAALAALPATFAAGMAHASEECFVCFDDPIQHKRQCLPTDCSFGDASLRQVGPVKPKGPVSFQSCLVNGKSARCTYNHPELLPEKSRN